MIIKSKGQSDKSDQFGRFITCTNKQITVLYDM